MTWNEYEPPRVDRCRDCRYYHEPSRECLQYTGQEGFGGGAVQKRSPGDWCTGFVRKVAGGSEEET